MLLVAFIIATVLALFGGLRLWKRLGSARFVLALLWFGGIVGVLALVIRFGGCADPPDRPELVQVGTQLQHPYGFELVAPPMTMTPDPDLADLLRNGYMTCQAWSSASEELVVCGAELDVHSRAELVADAAAVRRGIDRAADSLRSSLATRVIANQPNVPPSMQGTAALEALSASFPRWLPDEVSWTRDQGEARLGAVLGAATIRARLLTVRGGLALVWSISTDPGGLFDVVASLTRAR